MSVNSQLKEIEASLGEINKLTSDIANSWSKAGSSGNTGRAGMSGGPATNAATFSGTTPGGGGAGGSGGGGMGGMGMSALSGAMNFVGEAAFGNVPSAAAAASRMQNNFNYNMMNSWSGTSGFDMARVLRSANPMSQSSSGGVNAMMSGLASQGMIPSTMGGESGYVNMATSYMKMHEYGISNAEVPGWAKSTYSAESSNALKLMLGGNKGTIDSEGNLRAPEDIGQDIFGFTMPNIKNMSSAEIMKQMQSGRAMDINLKETGQEWLRPQMEEMASAYAWTRDAPNKRAVDILEKDYGWNTGEMTQSQIQAISGIQSGANPQQLSDNLVQAQAESDAALDDAKLKGVKDADNATVKYLHYLSEFPEVRGILAQIATFMGAGENAGATQRIAAAAAEYAGGSDAGATAVQKNRKLREFYRQSPGSEMFQEGGVYEQIGEDVRAEEAAKAAGINHPEEYGDGSAMGDWSVEKDKRELVHAGELIIPSRIATQVRKDLARGGKPIEGTPDDQVSRRKISSTTSPASSSEGTSGVNLTFNVTVQRASESEVQYLVSRVKHVLEQNRSLQAVSAGAF